MTEYNFKLNKNQLPQLKLAEKLRRYLKSLDITKNCIIHGSLTTGRADKYSDIDLQLDVSGSDNGKTARELPELLSKEFPVVYTAYGPRFAPDLYLVSFGLKDYSPFHFFDVEIIADPHVPSLSRQEIIDMTDISALRTKLLVGVLKKHLRGQEYKEELDFLVNPIKNEKDLKGRDLLRYCFQIQSEALSGDMKNICLECLEMI